MDENEEKTPENILAKYGMTSRDAPPTAEELFAAIGAPHAANSEILEFLRTHPVYVEYVKSVQRMEEEEQKKRAWKEGNPPQWTPEGRSFMRRTEEELEKRKGRGDGFLR